jgi:hypothetical protein
MLLEEMYLWDTKSRDVASYFLRVKTEEKVIDILVETSETSLMAYICMLVYNIFV